MYKEEIEPIIILLQEFFEMNNVHPRVAVSAMLSIICLKARDKNFTLEKFDEMMEKTKQTYRLYLEEE